MIEFAEPREIRPANENDIEPLKKNLPRGGKELHADRYAQQKSGEAVYLLAVQQEIPVGHVLLKWNGATDERIKENLADQTPDMEDLFVHEDHRNRRVASRLLETAETLARERGYKQIGLSCSAENTTARTLYEARGYLDSGIEPYTLSGKFIDAKGVEGEWVERDCSYLLLPLTVATTEAATETNMENNNHTTTPEQPTPADPNKTPEKPISDQVVDFAFGVALTAAEALEKAVLVLGEKAKVVQAEAPAVWEALQEKGRPAREKLVQSLREETREETEAAAQAKAEAPPVATEPVAEPTATVDVKPPVEPAPIKPAPRPFGFGRIGSVSAEDEIKALEERVKSLEREVVVTPLTTAIADAPTVTEDAINIAEPTAAESGTSLVDFTPESNVADALTDSPYAISDDEERALTPTQTGEWIEAPPIIVPVTEESSPEIVAVFVDGAASPEVASNTETESSTDSEPKLASGKSKRSKKATAETDSVEESPLATGDDLEA